LAAYNILLT